MSGLVTGEREEECPARDPWSLRRWHLDTPQGQSSVGLQMGSQAGEGHSTWGCGSRSPVEGQLVTLEEVGTVVGAQGGLTLAVAVGSLLHPAVGVQQALLTRPGLGPTAPESSEEPVAPLAEVGREEGVQLLPVEEGRWGWAEDSSVPAGWEEGAVLGCGEHGGVPGHEPPESPLPPSLQRVWLVRGLKAKPGDKMRAETRPIPEPHCDQRALGPSMCHRVWRVWIPKPAILQSKDTVNDLEPLMFCSAK